MSVVLNQHLVEKQELADCEVVHIKELHEILNTLFENMGALDPSNPEELEMLRHGAVELRDLEFALQRAWRFGENENFHSWWFRFPHCTCPKMDNQDMVGAEGWWSNGGCPIHDPSPYPSENTESE